MSLAALIARLGVAEIARRAGVTQATIRKWARTGPSAAGKAAIARIAVAHERAAKAARTRAALFQARVETPPDAELPPRAVKPGRAPTYAEKRAAIAAAKLGSIIATAGKPRGRRYHSDRYRTDRYHGERTWIHYAKPLSDVAPEEIIDAAETIWFDSGRNMAQVILLIFRYVPFNPAYGPNHHLFHRQGTWIPQWQSTQHLALPHSWAAARDSLAGNLEYLFTPGRSHEWGNTMGLNAQTATRVLWLESVCVKTFDEFKDDGRKGRR